jgi:hypothetical protein
LIFFGFSVSGQTCGQTVIFEKFERKYIAQKVSVYKAFRRFSKSNNNGAVSCSQSTRTTSRYKYEICNYSTCSYIITNLFRTVKWFNVLFLDFLKIFDADFVFRRHHLLYSFTNIFLFFPRGSLRNKKIPRRLGGGFYH